MKLLFLIMAVVNAASSVLAGELVYNLPSWGYEGHRAIPWKYLPGDGVHEVVNGRLRFFTVTEVKWDNATNGWKYIRVPDFRTKL